MAASRAENRVSFRSKEMIGFADAMYSITLIQVDTSFNGLEGSGSTQMSAAARLACNSSSDTKPVNSTQPLSCRFPARSDRKSTRLNSSHVSISYAVFCLKKKTQRIQEHYTY